MFSHLRVSFNLKSYANKSKVMMKRFNYRKDRLCRSETERMTLTEFEVLKHNCKHIIIKEWAY
jgi:hypothetical protein